MHTELFRALQRILDDFRNRALGAHPCASDHGAVLPCPDCGAAL